MLDIMAGIQGQINTAAGNTGATTDINGGVATALKVVFGIIGVVAVVMIILGGINYATSQGDAGKIKKGKDAILYGVIGLVISLLAFAIVEFVLKNI